MNSADDRLMEVVQVDDFDALIVGVSKRHASAVQAQHDGVEQSRRHNEISASLLQVGWPHDRRCVLRSDERDLLIAGEAADVKAEPLFVRRFAVVREPQIRVNLDLAPGHGRCNERVEFRLADGNLELGLAGVAMLDSSGGNSMARSSFRSNRKFQTLPSMQTPSFIAVLRRPPRSAGPPPG
jgi:hypothetical protein